MWCSTRKRDRDMMTRRTLAIMLCATSGFVACSHAFCFSSGAALPISAHHQRSTLFPGNNGFTCRSTSSSRTTQAGAAWRVSGRSRRRQTRTRLFESIRDNRDKIARAMSRLRDAMRAEDDELAERLKNFIMHLRQRDPQFATQDAMDEALAQGLFSTAAKLKLKLTEINQNPFRQGLLNSMTDGDGTVGGGASAISSDGDISEDMSWGFDQSFFEKEGEGEGEGEGEDDDYDEI